MGSPDWAEILDSGLDPEKTKRANDTVGLSMGGGIRYDSKRGVGRPGDVTDAAGVVPGSAEGRKPGSLELKSQASLGGREKESNFEPEKEDGKVQQGRSEQAGDIRGRVQGRSLAPLEGAPVIPDATGPDSGLVSAAEQYAKEKGIDLRRQSEYVKVDVDRSLRTFLNSIKRQTHWNEKGLKI